MNEEFPPFEAPTMMSELRLTFAEVQKWRPNRIRKALGVLDETIASAEAHGASAADLAELRSLYAVLGRRLVLARSTRLWHGLTARGRRRAALGAASDTGANPGQLLLLSRDEAAGAR